MRSNRLDDNQNIDVIWRRSRRAKRLTLRLSRLDGRVTLTLPMHIPEHEGRMFLEERSDWLQQKMAEIAPTKKVAVGSHVLFEGSQLMVRFVPNRPGGITDGHLDVPDAKHVGARVKALLSAVARDRLAAASDRHAAELDVRYNRLTLRDTRSRWGSCSSKGALMYSWRLIMAPPAVLDYVAAHEVAHLVEMNHSSAFWRLVARLCPDFQSQRRWLREAGEQLHRFDFSD